MVLENHLKESHFTIFTLLVTSVYFAYDMEVISYFDFKIETFR